MASIIREMALYKYNSQGDTVFVNGKRYRYRSQAQERMVADDYCEKLGYYNGEGFIAILEDGKCIDKLHLLVK